MNLKTFLLIIILAPAVAVAQSPGGVPATNLKLWNKANAGITTSGSTVTGWTDQTGVNTFTKIGAGTPQLQPASLNYNPTVLFNGNALYASNVYTSFTHVFAVGKIVNASGTGASGALMGIDTNVVGGFKYAFHTEGGSLYAAGNPGTGHTQTVVGNNIGYSIFGEDFGQTPAANDRMRLNGATQTNITSNDPASFTGKAALGGRGFEGLLSGSELAEAINFSSSLSAADVQKVESYLGIKYGITLSNTGGGANGDYVSAGGATVWDASVNSNYHRQVIGIAQDNNSALLQKQSHTSDDTTRIYLSSLQATNAGNGGSFGNDASFIMMGNNGGLMERDYATLSEFPPGNSIYRRIDREWKVTNTNFNNSFSMDVKLSTANITAIDLVLLVDDDGDFTNAQVFNPSVTYSGGVVTVSGITTAMIPANSTRYITIASINSRSPLPVELVEFTANLTAAKKVRLNWRTATEINSDYFAIERSGNNMQWQEIGQVKAAGNSTQQLLYSFMDNNPLKGTSYYRLRQVDMDGKFSYSGVRLAVINEDGRVLVYPQPASDRITLEAVTGNSNEIVITDITGRVVTSNVKLVSAQAGRIVYDITSLPPAVYLIKTASGTVKVIKQ